MNSTISRRFFLSAAATIPAAAPLPQAAIAMTMEPTKTAAPIALLRIISNRQPVEGMLKALAAIIPPAGKTPENVAYQVKQLSCMMLHIDTLKHTGIELHDFSENTLEALETSAGIKDSTEELNASIALGHIQTLSASGCRNWQDLTKYLAQKSLPLLRDIENGAFTSLVKSSGTDGGVSAAIKHLSKEFEEILGKDFVSLKPAFESSSCTLEDQWKNALTDIIHLDQKTFSVKPSVQGLSLETFHRHIAVVPLFPSHNRQAFFFRLTSQKGECLTFMDICRLSRQLAPGSPLPLQWPRQKGKEGLIISTTDRKLAIFLSASHTPAPMTDMRRPLFRPNARP